MGAKLAKPDRPVIGFTGDGGAMYTIQALWTAARLDIDAKFVVCNNASYRILQDNISMYWREREFAAHEFPQSFDLSYPPLRFDRMAESMSVPAARVETPEQIAPAIDRMLTHRGPFLIDLVLESNTRPEAIRKSAGAADPKA
jgi:benzoylformate decarboxylase